MKNLKQSFKNIFDFFTEDIEGFMYLIIILIIGYKTILYVYENNTFVLW